MARPGYFSNWREDLPASFVVFLVALPLCLGIAIACGVPPALGLLSGIIGGIVVGFFAGAPLQVSGPAAGLTVLVFDLVQKHGLEGLGVAVLLAGLVQVVAGVLKLGRWFRAVSPSVIHGMLAGIGVLIFASQMHVLVDDTPAGSGLVNLFTIPAAIMKGVLPADGTTHHVAAFVGVASLVALIAWERLRPENLKLIPAPLVAVVVGTALTLAMDLPVNRVAVPERLTDAMQWPNIALLGNSSLVMAGLAIAFIASAETLLCAVAVDKLHNGPRADFNRELLAQGIGNTFAGLIGALPMTGVIVRSSANVQAGGKTRLSAIVHGVFLLVFVVALPGLLNEIPRTTLAAILVYIGLKLAHPRQVVALARHGKGEVFIFLATVAGIVGVNLLAGVVLGFALSLLGMAFELVRRSKVQTPRLHLDIQHAGGQTTMDMRGVASFLALPSLADALQAIPAESPVTLAHDALDYLDPACLELVEDWHAQRVERGGGLVGGDLALERLAAAR